MVCGTCVQLSIVQENVLDWKKKLRQFLSGLDKMESSMKERVREL